MNSLFIRALVALLALPGMVAFVIPLWIARSTSNGVSNLLGGLPLTAGSVLLLACVREFYVAGRGTLAPWSPPTSLVVTGLYRWSRNPMHVAVLLILCGWAIGFRSWPLAVYALVIFTAFHLRILLHEEPWLERSFGDAWFQYRNRVRRWL